MANFSVAKTTSAVGHVLHRPEAQWLTTADAARMLQVSDRGVRWLAQRGGLRFEATESGQRLFRYGDVARLVEQRAHARLVGLMPQRMPDEGPRQLSLFGKARLRLVDVDTSETSLPDPEAKGSPSLKDLA